MTQELKEKIARNAASGWCRCFKCDKTVRDIDEYPYPCEKEKLKTCSQWYHGYRTALLALADDRLFSGLWKPADGDDLPEIDREVIVLVGVKNPVTTDSMWGCEVAFAHRPNPDGWDGKSITTGKVEHYDVQTYGKGGWNIPDVKFWLDCELPKMEE